MAVIAGWPLPFIAAQILWINLVTNGLQDVALAFERGEPGLLRRPPRPRGEGLIMRRLLERLGLVGIVLAALGAHMAVLHAPFLQRVSQTVHLSSSDWLWITLVGTLVIAGGEIDKWWNRRKVRPLG